MLIACPYLTKLDNTNAYVFHEPSFFLTSAQYFAYNKTFQEEFTCFWQSNPNRFNVKFEQIAETFYDPFEKSFSIISRKSSSSIYRYLFKQDENLNMDSGVFREGYEGEDCNINKPQHLQLNSIISRDYCSNGLYYAWDDPIESIVKEQWIAVVEK